MRNIIIGLLLTLMGTVGWGADKELIIYCAVDDQLTPDKDIETTIFKLSGANISYKDRSGTIFYWGDEIIVASVLGLPESSASHMFIKTGNNTYDYRMAAVHSDDTKYGMYGGECQIF